MLSLENKNTKVNGSNKIRSLNQNFKARLKDKLGFTLNPYTLVNNALRCKKSGSLQFKSELIEEVHQNLLKIIELHLMTVLLITTLQSCFSDKNALR